jgi:hypothetical protein
MFTHSADFGDSFTKAFRFLSLVEEGLEWFLGIFRIRTDTTSVWGAIPNENSSSSVALVASFSSLPPPPPSWLNSWRTNRFGCCLL